MEGVIWLRRGNWSAAVDPLHGANCVALRNSRYGARLLREFDGEGEKDNPFLYGMPILFPVNRIRGGRFLFEGREYRFPVNESATGCHLHGELHRTPFAVLAAEGHRARFRYEAEEGEYLSFPHAFAVTMEYELEEKGLRHRVTVENRSSQTMPLMLGFHTTFATCFTENTREENVRVQGKIDEEYERNLGVDYLPTGRLLAPDEVTEALRRGSFCPKGVDLSRHCKSKGDMLLRDEENGLRLRYCNSENYAFRLLYAQDNGGFLCLEPQSCAVDCWNEPLRSKTEGAPVLRAGEKEAFESLMLLEEETP